MNFAKTAAVLGALVILGACQTTGEVGSGNITLSSGLKNGYIAYLAHPSLEGTSQVRGAFAINSSTNAWGWSTSWGDLNARSKAINRALDNCGAGCKIFDINKRIVWEGFSKKQEYRKIASAMGRNDAVVENYNPNNFKISSAQLSEYKWKYLVEVRDRSSGNLAFAISSDGKTAKWMKRVDRRNTNFYSLKRTVVAMCNAISDTDDCMIV